MATIGERVIEFFGGVTSVRMKEAATRAYEAGYSDGNDDPATAQFRKGGQSYRRHTTKTLRDFTKISRGEALKTVWSLWQSSPIARRVLVLKRDHIIGRSAAPKTDDEELADLLSDFWQRNKLHKRSGEFALQLFLLGEQCYPAFVRQTDGAVSIGYFDTEEIAEVITHPHNAMEPIAVIIKATTSGKAWLHDRSTRVYRIIREDEDWADEDTVYAAAHPGKLVTAEQANVQPWELLMLREYGRSRYDGSVFFTKTNSLSNQSRGHSDLLQVADWIDQAEETLFSLAEREQLANYFAFDVTLEGVDQDKVNERAKAIRNKPPGKGTVNVHNDKETWQFWTAELGQAGSIASFRALLGFILGGVGFPVHWYGFGDDANRATATVQGEPTTKSLEYDQGIIKDMFMMMLRFQIDQAIIAGGSYDDDYDLPLPEVSKKSTKEIVSLFQPFAAALLAATESELITQETAVVSWARLMSEYGIEIDPAKEMQAIEDAASQRRMDDEQGKTDAIRSMVNELQLNGNS